MQRAKLANDCATWVSNVLQTNDVRTIDDLKTGVALVQLVHSLDPDAFDLARVDFRASNDYYFSRNLKLLQDVLAKNKVALEFNLAAVAQGEKRNDLFGLVSYLKLHYATIKERLNSRSALTYDPVLERRRAQERRAARHAGTRVKQFRVAELSRAGGNGVPSSAASAPEFGYVPASHDTATVISEGSHLSAYTSLSTKQRCTRMKLRSEELERWARNVQMPARRVSSHDMLASLSVSAMVAASGGAAAAGGASGLSSRTPYRPPSRTASHAQAPATLPISAAFDLQPIALHGGDLQCMDRWPTAEFVDRDELERSAASPRPAPHHHHNGANPGGGSATAAGSTRSPTRQPRGGAWTVFDAVFAEFDASMPPTTAPAPSTAAAKA